MAKPRIGPVPNWNRNIAAISDATCVSTIVHQTRSNPALIGRAAPPLAGGQLFLDALEDEDIRIDAHADREDEAGQCPEASSSPPDTPSSRAGSIRLTTIEITAFRPDQFVVEEDEDHHEREAANRSRRCRHRIDACPKRRTDGSLLKKVHRRGQCASAEDQ